jgi:hypothetical protein
LIFSHDLCLCDEYSFTANPEEPMKENAPKFLLLLFAIFILQCAEGEPTLA